MSLFSCFEKNILIFSWFENIFLKSRNFSQNDLKKEIQCKLQKSRRILQSQAPTCNNFKMLHPGDFFTKVKQINSQSDLFWMTSFAGSSYLTIRSTVYIILIWDPCIFNFYNLCQTGSNYVRQEPQQYALHFNQ